MKLPVLLLAGWCVVAGQAQAGLFSDDEAHNKIQQLDSRISRVEESNKQQGEASKQQTQSLLDLQTQIEAQNVELRKIRGQLEELTHGLREAEGRQKDFYVDLDTRLRHFETLEATPPPPAPVVAPAPPPVAPAPVAPLAPIVQPDIPLESEGSDSLAVENRAYEAAYRLFKAGNHQKANSAFQEFLKKFPDSVNVPNVHYAMGNAYLALKDYKKALDSYQLLVSKYSYHPKIAEALFGIADSQQELNDKAGAKKTLKQIIAKYPGTDLAEKARKRLALLK